jgi:site-specific DNA-cytosine methylase
MVDGLLHVFWKKAMNLTDATLVLLLAAHIHGTDEAVRASAESVLKKLPRSKRRPIYKVIGAKSPLALVRLLADTLEE